MSKMSNSEWLVRYGFVNAFKLIKWLYEQGRMEDIEAAFSSVETGLKLLQEMGAADYLAWKKKLELDDEDFKK